MLDLPLSSQLKNNCHCHVLKINHFADCSCNESHLAHRTTTAVCNEMCSSNGINSSQIKSHKKMIWLAFLVSLQRFSVPWNYGNRACFIANSCNEPRKNCSK